MYLACISPTSRLHLAYISPISPHTSQVASGALDRLHQESDACVRYDAERKVRG